MLPKRFAFVERLCQSVVDLRRVDRRKGHLDTIPKLVSHKAAEPRLRIDVRCEKVNAAQPRNKLQPVLPERLAPGSSVGQKVVESNKHLSPAQRHCSKKRDRLPRCDLYLKCGSGGVVFHEIAKRPTFDRDSIQLTFKLLCDAVRGRTVEMKIKKLVLDADLL